MEKENEINIKRLIDIIISKKKIIVLILIIALALGYFYSYYLKQDVYKSSETILLSQNEQDKETQITQNDLNINTNLISTYSNIAKSSKIIEKTINNLGIEIPIKELQNNILVEAKKNTQIIEITIKNKNPQLAMELTKELTNVFMEEIKNIYNLENISIIDEAEVEKIPCNVNHIKDISIFVFAGIGLIGVLVLVFYTFDDTIKEESDIISYTTLKPLGTIPIIEGTHDSLELITHLNPKSFISESIRTVRTNILYMTALNKRKAILITSPKQEEGKTWITNNIAVSFANANKKTIIVSCDLRKHGDNANIFNVKNDKGLSDCIHQITKNKIENVELVGKHIKETQIPNLHILTNGTIPPNPSELISSSKMKNVIDTLKYMYDIVILDSTPCLEVSDSVAIASMVDNVILVAENKKTRISEINKSKKIIEDVNGKILGVILNKKRFDKSRYYGKRYGYYGNDKENTNNIKVVQQNYTVQEIIEQAKINIQKEKNTDRIITPKENNRDKKPEVRVIKLIKKVFEKVLKVQKNINKYKTKQKTKEKELLQKQEKINKHIINEIYDFKIEQEQKNIDILNKMKDLQTEQEITNNKFIEYDRKNQNRDIKVEKLEKQNKQILKNINILRKDKEEIIKNINELTEKNKKMSEILEEFIQEKENITQNINTLKDKNTLILEQIENLKEERKDIDKSIQQLEDRNKTLTNGVDNMSSTISELLDKHNNIEDTINYLRKQRKNILEDIQTLKNKNGYIEENINGLKNEKVNVLETVRYLREDQKYIINNINSLKEENNAIIEKNKKINERNRILEEQNNNNLEKMYKIHNNSKKMNVRIKELKHTVKELQDEIETLKELNERLTNTEDTFSQARIMQSMQISNINRQLEEIRKTQQEKEQTFDKNETNSTKKQKSNVIINFESLKQRNTKVKDTFSIKDDIMYDDLERASEVIIDLQNNSKENSKIVNN